MDPKEVIPNSLVVRSAEQHLYRIGLSFTPISDEKRRNFLFEPKLIFFILCLQYIKAFPMIFLPESTVNPYVFVVLGEFGHFVKMRSVGNMALICFGTLAIGTQLIYFYNHMKRPKANIPSRFRNDFRIYYSDQYWS